MSIAAHDIRAARIAEEKPPLPCAGGRGGDRQGLHIARSRRESGWTRFCPSFLLTNLVVVAFARARAAVSAVRAAYDSNILRSIVRRVGAVDRGAVSPRHLVHREMAIVSSTRRLGIVLCEFVRIRSLRAHASIRICSPFVNTDRVSPYVRTNFKSLRGWRSQERESSNLSFRTNLRSLFRRRLPTLASTKVGRPL